MPVRRRGGVTVSLAAGVPQRGQKRVSGASSKPQLAQDVIPGLSYSNVALKSLSTLSTLFSMPTVLQLARHASVSTENVLRVLNGEPVSASVSESVWQAIDEL